jgi:hypothetical protein
MLRQRLNTRINTFHLKVMLANWWMPMAQQEDEWDALVEMHAGRGGDSEEGGVEWVDAISLSEKENKEMYERYQLKERDTTRKMQRIVDSEMQLALKEGQTIVRGRKRRPIKVIKPTLQRR